MQRIEIYEKMPSKNKEDVKYVPKKCMSKELQEKSEKFYQYKQ